VRKNKPNHSIQNRQIQVQRHCHPEIVFDSYVLIDTKVFGQSEMSNFENRNKATEEAIKEANKIYNYDTMRSNII